jgi:zinc D-Ala-D-Ala dipeptidase
MSFFCILTLLMGSTPCQVDSDELVNEEKDLMSAQLVDIKTLAPGIQVDLRYATADNFTGEIVYDFQSCFVCRAVALKLCNVQTELEALGLGLKIWDGFRPVAAQQKFWDLLPDERYVSNPLKGGRHTRGTAVDVTLVTRDYQELEMPTAFDDFSEKAHRGYENVSEEAFANAHLLEGIMEKHGFIGMASKWWHFDLAGWEKFPPMTESR